MFLPRATHVSERVADAPDAWLTAHMILSHLAMLVASVYALMCPIRRRHGPGAEELRRSVRRVGTAGLVETLVSVAYHLCRSPLGVCVAGLSLDELRKGDHTTALFLLGALALYALAASSMARRAAQTVVDCAGYALPIVAMFAVRADPYGFQSIVVVAAFVLAIAAYRFLFAGDGFAPPPSGTYSGRLLLLTVVLGAAAGFCFFIDDGAPQNDSLLDGHIHALWHWLAGFCIWALVAALVCDPDTPAELQQQQQQQQQQPPTLVTDSPIML